MARLRTTSFTTAVTAAATALLAWAGAGSAHAQVAVDPAGYPLRLQSVTLTRGHTYEFRTDYTLTALPGAGTPDSILTLRANSGAATALAGADGCTAPTGFSLRPSCFSYAVPAGTGTTTSTLYLRAFRTTTPGQTDLWMRDVTAGTAWEKLTSTPITFGGGVMSRSYSGNARLFINTTHRPGRSNWHTLWAAQDEFNIFRSQSINGRAPGTAKFDFADRGAANFAGSRQIVFGTLFSDQAGPIRVIENDWHLAGADVDGDGLGLTVEAALGACDRSTQVLASGFRCDSLPGCGAPSSSLCLSSLRDTDHDGLRDDLETFGGPDVWQTLPRWGANPAHMDVFIELDAVDQDNDPSNGCQGFAAATIKNIGGWSLAGSTVRTLDFFADAQRLYGQAPASMNPDNLPGITLHWDVGVDNPNPQDASWGNWGGGNTCMSIAPPGADGCDYIEAFYQADTDCPANTFRPSRRWIFRYGQDGLGQGGQTWGGKETYIAGLVADHVHELGHMGKLEHGGPEGSTGSYDHFSNHRPHYASRMNYSYSFIGGADAVDLANWDKMSFSSGHLGGLGFRSDALKELCPLPGKNLSFLSLIGTAVRQDATTGCWDVDWNRNGTYDAGNTFDQSLAHWYHIVRFSILGARRGVGSAPSAATFGNLLVLAYPVDEADFGHQIYLRADSNADCALAPNAYGSVPIDDGFGTGGAHPGCIRPGTPFATSVYADAAAISTARVRSGSTWVEGMIMVYSQSNQLKWAKLGVASAAAPAEATFTITNMGNVPGAVIDATAAGREPALVRLPDSNAVLLIYRDAAGALREAVLPAGSDTWSPVRNVRQYNVSTGTYTNLSSATAVSMTVQNSETILALTEPGTSRLKTYRWERSASGPLEDRWFLSEATLSPSATTVLRPTIVSARELSNPAQNTLYLYYVAADRRLKYARFAPASRTSVAAYSEFWGGAKLAAAPAAVFDARSVAGSGRQGLRVFRDMAVGCTVHADCAGVGGGACDATLGVCRDSWSNVVGAMEEDPFAQGVEPGLYTDYDDWKGLKWGFCSALQDRLGAFAPSTTSDLVPTAYTVADCGPRPGYPEP
jgi:hypothetical protein